MVKCLSKSMETWEELSTNCNLKVMSPVGDVASGGDRHLDITFGLQLNALPFFLYFLEKRLTIPTYLFFHLLVNVFFVIRECGSTLYVGLACAVPPTITNFRLTF